MCTILITYSTPPAPPPREDADHRGAATVDDTPSVELMVAGIDEAIAATIATELARAGHRVTCRPCVATTTELGFDLVVVVDHLHVSHRSGSDGPLSPDDAGVAQPYAVERARRSDAPRIRQHELVLGAPIRAPLGESTIPMTWCADWRAVEAWARSIGDHLARFLEMRAELVRIRAELVRCRALLKAVTPEPRAASAVELGRPVGAARAVHHDQRRALARPGRRS